MLQEDTAYSEITCRVEKYKESRIVTLTESPPDETEVMSRQLYEVLRHVRNLSNADYSSHAGDKMDPQRRSNIILSDACLYDAGPLCYFVWLKLVWNKKEPGERSGPRCPLSLNLLVGPYFISKIYRLRHDPT